VVISTVPATGLPLEFLEAEVTDVVPNLHPQWQAEYLIPEILNGGKLKTAGCVKSTRWTHQDLHDQTVSFRHISGALVEGKFTAIPYRDGMRILVGYPVGGGAAARCELTQEMVDKIELYPDGPTKFTLL
jgi:hypothetical protein